MRMDNSLPPPATDWIGMMVACFMGILGRLYVIAHKDPKPLGWPLAWELLVGMPLGMIGWGITVAIGWQGTALSAMVIVVTSIAGARVVDAAIQVVLARINEGAKK